MKKLTLSMVIMAIFHTSNLLAVKVMKFEDTFASTPATNWGFAAVSGHTFTYDATNHLEQIRWSGTSNSSKAITAVTAGTDNKITVEIILKDWGSGNSSSGGGLYFFDSNQTTSPIFGIVMRYTSSGQRIAWASGTIPAYQSNMAYPGSTNPILNVTTPTAKITAILDMTNKTIDYTMVDGTFDYTTRVFTTGSNSASGTGVAFLNTSATQLDAFQSNFYNSSSSGTRGFDLMYVGISREETASTANVTVNYIDVADESTIKSEIHADQVVGSTYSASTSDKTAFTQASYYYTYSSMKLDNQTVTSDGLAHVDVYMKKYPVYSGTYSWTGATDGNWNELTPNFSDGSNDIGYQSGNATIFPETATTKSVILSQSFNLGSNNVTVSGSGYDFTGSGILSGTGSFIVNPGSGNATSLNITNNLTGGVNVQSGTAVINSTSSGASYTMANGSKIILNTGADFSKSISGTGTITIEAASDKHYTSNITGASTVNVILNNAGSYSSNEWTDEFKCTMPTNAQVNVTTSLASPNSAGYAINNTVVANSKVNLGENIRLIGFYNQSLTPAIGELTGAVSSTLENVPSNTNSVTYSIGGLNTNAIFNGLITNMTGYTGALNINKVGSGIWSLSGSSTNYINGSFNVSDGEVIISNGATLGTSTPSIAMSVAAGKKLTNIGTINASSLTLNSDINGSATFVNTGTANITSAIVNEYLSSARNWYVSSPLTGATVPAGYTFYGYEENGSNTSTTYPNETEYWKAYPVGTTLTRGKGYVVQPTDAATIQYTGSFSDNTDISVSLTRTANKTKEGFNLIGNPYPSYLNAMAAINADTTKVHTSIWYRTKGTAYSFETVNTSYGIGTNGVTGFIPPMQAFWVRVKPNANPLQNNSATLTFTNTMRYHAGTYNGSTTTLLKTRSAVLDKIIRLTVSNGVNADETILYTNANASNNYDSFDSNKMSNDNASIPELYTTLSTETLVINGFKQFPENVEIALGFKTGESNSFTLRATQIQNFNANEKLMLKDKLQNTEYELSEGKEIAFTSEIVNTTERFSLILRTIGAITDVKPITGNNIKWSVYTNPNKQIVVAGANTGNSISVYSLTGQKITSQKSTSQFEIIQGINVPGVYMVTINNEVKKVIIK